MSFASSALPGQVSTLLLRPAPFIIGDLTLTGHEVPARISIGGAQAVTIHKMPGGSRVIDAMGADPGAISWRGVFSGPGAAARARAMDFMRGQGTPRILSFGDYTLSIVIVHFEYDYQDQGAVIAYRIRGEIVPDGGATDSAPAVGFAVQGDLSTAQDVLLGAQAVASSYAALAGARTGASSASSAVAMASASTSLAATSVLANSDLTTTASATSVQVGLQAAAVILSGAIEGASSSVLSTTGNSLSFSTGSVLAATTAQAAALAALVRSSGYVNRANANVATVNAQALGPLIHS